MKNKPLKDALILCAGFGTRLHPLTLKRPKALMQIGDVVILDRIISQLKAAGIDRIFVNSHYLAEQIDAHITEFHQDVTNIFEPEILETAGAIENVMNEYEVHSLFVVNCDAFFLDENPFSEMLEFWNPKNMDALFMLVKHPQEQSNILNCDMNGRIYLCDSNGFTLSGAYIITRNALWNQSWINKSTRDVLFCNIAKPEHKVFGYIYSHIWMDIGTIKDLQSAINICK